MEDKYLRALMEIESEWKKVFGEDLPGTMIGLAQFGMLRECLEQ